MSTASGAGTGSAHGGRTVRMPEAPVSEREARSVTGWGPLLGSLVLIAVGASLQDAIGKPWSTNVGVVLIALAVINMLGVTGVFPGQARVGALFSRYSGTVLETAQS